MLSLIPGLHIYNVIGFAMLIYLPVIDIIEPFLMVALLIGMMVGYAVLFTIPTVYLAVPDDSTMFIILPAQKYLRQGRGHEAVVITGIGSLAALFVVALLLPLLLTQLVVLRDIFVDHAFWIIGAIIVFILMTEWPKDFGTGRTKLQRLKDGWSTLAAGYLTFFLASMLGIIVFYRTIIPVENAFQNLMPVFIGLFAAPMVILNIIADFRIPRQHIAKSYDLGKTELVRGSAAGCAGGFLGAFTPAVTPGPASLIAGHATAARDDRIFLLSQGAARVLYYVGALVIFFLPLLHKRKGGLCININLFFIPETTEQFLVVGALIAICGALAFILLIYYSRLFSKYLPRYNYKTISWIVLFIIIAIVFVMTSWQGLIVFAVSTAIGLVPNLFYTRRINLLAVLLVPIWLNMAGFGPGIASFLGLI